MTPSATDIDLPPLSALQDNINDSKITIEQSPHPAYLHHLATQILHDLQHQHDWTFLTIHKRSTLTANPLPRPIISGLPPRRAYIHPDEQIEILKAEHESGVSIKHEPEREWVLPSQIQETWSLAKFTAVFDALDTVPPGDSGKEDEGERSVGWKWQGKNRQKRLLLGTVHDDSTVVYYIMHDGIVKPRQN
ncbi:putative tRNA-splicing endonuclease subunit tsp-1 [Lachnellula hyalina]|uniref:Putative tRNA-splicing endonuclease subunit tsp-1 n=1 Tax=Lachnellula hyalina TaxID=1316788 RepID=A0A8H8R3P3_9HELO|nr:putative tRNA-splicing endonuclease subunit tsp-1 [Lachnellula hyalina]TVY27788.1 putative tRNA-splicing endonuclease subunit tsp-1 [Lachnellula hyalina]